MKIQKILQSIVSSVTDWTRRAGIAEEQTRSQRNQSKVSYAQWQVVMRSPAGWMDCGDRGNYFAGDEQYGVGKIREEILSLCHRTHSN